jgi:hypothetical protein
MTLVRPPRRVGEQIGPRLRAAWPFKIAGDRTSEDEIYTIELKRNAIGGLCPLHMNILMLTWIHASA